MRCSSSCAATWGTLDFLVHAIGFSDRNELKGRYADTTRANFSRTMVISCFSFTEVAKRAAEMMPQSGGAMLTLTYGGSMRVMPNYNVMGLAKAALEASVRYLANDFGRAGDSRQCDLGGARAHAGGRRHFRRALHVLVPAAAHAAAADRDASTRSAMPALYLLSDLSSGVTGEIHFVDSGYNIISMPRAEALKLIDEAEAAVESPDKRDDDSAVIPERVHSLDSVASSPTRADQACSRIVAASVSDDGAHPPHARAGMPGVLRRRRGSGRTTVATAPS